MKDVANAIMHAMAKPIGCRVSNFVSPVYVGKMAKPRFSGWRARA
jgi:hypothetical protein